jgi:acetolactate synthase I/II/III large subunit
VEKAQDVEPAIRQAQQIDDRPVVIDFIVGADAQVWPMVAAGTSNDEIMAARGIRPLFDDSESADEVAVAVASAAVLHSHDAMNRGSAQ